MTKATSTNEAPSAPWAPAAPETPPAAMADVAPPAAPEVEEAVEVISEDMVTVTVPKQFNLCVDIGNIVTYKPGVQQMPVSHAKHWYSEANGVAVYDPKA